MFVESIHQVYVADNQLNLGKNNQLLIKPSKAQQTEQEKKT